MRQCSMRIALVGCGAVTERGHLPAARMAGCQVVLLVDRNLARARDLAKAWAVPAVSDDYRDAIDHADAAIVALPNHLHAPVSCELLEAGLHVLVEKPMATSSSECQAMLAASEKGQAVIQVALMRRFLRSGHLARWVLDQDLLGSVETFDFREGNVYNWPVQSDFLFRRETSRGGVLFDTGAHTLDLLLWWLGDVASVEYCDDSYGGVEADCELSLTMESGAKGIVELSRTRDLRNTATIQGRRGTLEVHLRQNWATLRSQDGNVGLAGHGFVSDRSEASDQPFDSLFLPQLEDWLTAISGDHEPTVSDKDAIRCIELIESCYAVRQPLHLPWVQTAHSGGGVLCR